MEVYVAIVIWNDETKMQPYAFDSISKMYEFGGSAIDDVNIKDVEYHILTVR